MADAFGGFPIDGIRFLHGLVESNTKAYFDAHRATYTTALAEPVRALVDEVGQKLRLDVTADLRFEPKIGRSLFRINRDTRFAADKTPYHPWIDVVWWVGDDARKSPAVIFRLAADHLIAGAGIMGLRDESLARYRTAVAADASGTALERVLADLARTIDDLEVTEPTRKRVPAPYAQDHPRAALLRCDALHASVRRSHPPTLHEAAFADTLVDLLTPFSPLLRWLVDHR